FFLPISSLGWCDRVARKYGYDDSWEELGDSELKESKQQAERNNNLPHQSGIRRFFSYLTGGDRQMKQPQVAKETPPRHQVIEDDTNLLDKNDIRQLLPDVTVTASEVQRISEMGATASSEERNDFSP
uniref:Uncharacterized protein n=1 Tax=Ciona savignyi TaxID=51511 RepID=H2YQ06_CIOSA